jgi:hypothetical protein
MVFGKPSIRAENLFPQAALDLPPLITSECASFFLDKRIFLHKPVGIFTESLIFYG